MVLMKGLLSFIRGALTMPHIKISLHPHSLGLVLVARRAVELGLSIWLAVSSLSISRTKYRHLNTFHATVNISGTLKGHGIYTRTVCRGAIMHVQSTYGSAIQNTEVDCRAL